jgi:hypothetical protein
VQLYKPTYRGGNFNTIEPTEIGRTLFARADLLVTVVVIIAAAPGINQGRQPS